MFAARMVGLREISDSRSLSQSLNEARARQDTHTGESTINTDGGNGNNLT